METTHQYYGIDVSQSSLQIALLKQDGIWEDTTIANEIFAIDTWLSGIDLSKSWFVFEYTGTYSQRFTYCLNLSDAHFSILTPQQSKGFSQSLKKIAKTDKQDARSLAVYGKKMTPIQTLIADESLHQKRQKYKHLSALKANKQSFNNRIHSLSYDPMADKTVVESTHEIIDFLDLQIQKIHQELFTIDDDEFDRIQQLMTNVTGIGVASAQALIIATNGFRDFDDPKQVSKFIGTSPTDRQSGTSLKGKGTINKSGVSYVRTTLYLAAMNAVRYNNACKNLYTRLRAKGKPFKVAIVAAINKLIKQLFAVVKNNTVFDNNLTFAK
jgi:transposase